MIKMKKTILSMSILALLLCAQISTSADCNCTYTEKGYVTVSATAEKEVAPDTVEITLGVTTYDTKSMQKASLQNKEISDKIYAELKNLINPNNGDFIRTSNYNATSLYTYNNGKRNFDKYQVSNNVILKTKSIDKIGEIIDKATSLGATNVNNLNFTLSEYDIYSEELITQAAKKAHSKAVALAKASSSEVVGVKNISVNANNAAYPRVYANVMMKSAAGAEDSVVESSSPIEPGTIKLKVTVNASYFLK